MSITSLDKAIKAIDQLHERGVTYVVLTSFAHESESAFLSLVGSQKHFNEATARRFEIQFPRLSGYFTGTGDLLSALLLAWFHICNDNFQLACEKALATVQAIIQRTSQERERELGLNAESSLQEQHTSIYMRATELKLLESKRDIEQPVILYQAKPLIIQD
jgi:pyridoxine kinase